MILTPATPRASDAKWPDKPREKRENEVGSEYRKFSRAKDRPRTAGSTESDTDDLVTSGVDTKEDQITLCDVPQLANPGTMKLSDELFDLEDCDVSMDEIDGLFDRYAVCLCYRLLLHYLAVEEHWPDGLCAYRLKKPSDPSSVVSDSAIRCSAHIPEPDGKSVHDGKCNFQFHSLTRSEFTHAPFVLDKGDLLEFCWSGRWMSWQCTAAYLLSNSTEKEKQHLLTSGSTVHIPWDNPGSEPGDTLNQPTAARWNNQGEQLCPLLPPISLPIWSPPSLTSDDERDESLMSENTCREAMQSSSQPMESLLQMSQMHKGAMTPELSRLSSTPDEAGYFSDEGGDLTQMKSLRKRSIRNERRMSVQGTIHLTSEQLHDLHLRFGVNEAVFSVITKYQGTCQCACFIYLWDSSTKLVISDIDGTITRSDWLGQLMPLVGYDWIHSSVVRLYDRIALNGYQFIYVSSRPIGQARSTRKFLHTVRQGDCHLPDGPIIVAPSSVFEAFHKEVIQRKADEFKIACLKEIKEAFKDDDAPQEEPLPFIAGFGNRISDIKTYRAVGLKDTQIFTVNYKGRVTCGRYGQEWTSPDKKKPIRSKVKTQKATGVASEAEHQPTEEPGNTETGKIDLTYDALLSMVHNYFPQPHDRLVHADDCSDYTFWRL
ncbi:unnamed protein product [Echinostoma caproni]|uniref:LNS2 domain-containing protein n=1 Tax=Echinostoma caproni TaxID=27848 RepID=A0A183A5M1_9TREM|nr:unnamed protein product [Echinostoma caproni]